MSLFILIPYFTGTSFTSYDELSKGAVGWFYAANEVGAIMVCLFPFVYYLLFERTPVFKSIFIFIIIITTMVLLGTKTSFLGMLITEVVYLIYFLLNHKKNRGLPFKISLMIIILSFILIPNIPAIKNLRSSISNSTNIIENNKDDKENISSTYYKNNANLERIFKVALSGRDEFFFRTMSIYNTSSIQDKLFGLGFVNRPSINNKKVEKLIEIDPLDIFFHYGIIGFIIYFGPLAYIILRTLKSISKNKFSLTYFKLTNIYVIGIITLISMIAGHVYGAPPVSIYVIFSCGMLDSALTKSELPKEEKERKKITIFALHLGYGGVEKYLSSLCRMLEDSYDIEIISTYKLLDKPAFPFSDKIKITYLINEGPNKESFKKALKNKQVINILKEGLKAVKILYQKRTRNIKAITNTYSDYIITTRPFHNNLVGYYAYNDIIKIATEHNYHNNNQKYIKKVINSIKDYHYLVVVSNPLKDFYQDKIGKTKCLYIPNVIEDIPKYHKIIKTNNKLISIGRLSKEKGYTDLIEVIALIKKEIPNIKLDIYGDGSEKETLENKIKELSLTKNITLCGFTPQEEINKKMNDYDLYIMTSHTESFGLVLIEAMASSLPCIAFDTASGARELLKEQNGILIKDRNKEEMAKTIISLLKDLKKREEKSQKAYNSITKYHIDNVKKEWLNFLKS